MTAWLISKAPWIALGLALFGAGTWSGHKLAQPAYNRLQAQYSAFQLQVSQAQAAAQKAATDALQAQIDQRNAVEANNAALQDSLAKTQADAAAAHSDADFASRLLTAARQAASRSGSDSVPAAQGGQQPADPAGASGNRQTPSLLGDVTDSAAECREAIQRLAGLQLEIVPQIKP